jgi:cupin fold WbuC family metalloprotein
MRETTMRRVSPLATASGHARAAVADDDLILRTCRAARENPRGREVLRLHASDDEPLQRMVNALRPGSYVQPHRHVTPEKAEGFVILCGALGVVLFDEAGNARESDFILLDRERGVHLADIRPGVWHTIFALAPDTAVYEAKAGPYLPDSDKGFAPFAPAEGSPGAAAYLMALEDRFRSVWGLAPRAWGRP